MKKIYLHPLPVRIWHWSNAFLIIMLMLTGIQLRIPDIVPFPQYGVVVALHKYLGYLLTLSLSPSRNMGLLSRSTNISGIC